MQPISCPKDIPARPNSCCFSLLRPRPQPPSLCPSPSLSAFADRSSQIPTSFPLPPSSAQVLESFPLRSLLSAAAAIPCLRRSSRQTSYPPIFLLICNLIGQMDLETENRIAAMLMKEAAELRRQAEKEGVHAYLKHPNSRFRPNSRFLTATVLGVQQANRAVEVNEMWRARQKELELDDRCKGKFRNGSSNSSSLIDNYGVNKSRTLVNVNSASASCSSSERVYESGSSRDDEELEEFLHSRAKRGRGGVGPRMDETGPYLPPSSDSIEDRSRSPVAWRRHVVYGPEKPSSLKSHDSSEEETKEEKRKKSKKLHSGSSDKQHSRKHKSKDNSKDKKKRRKEEKRNKHRK